MYAPLLASIAPCYYEKSLRDPAAALTTCAVARSNMVLVSKMHIPNTNTFVSVLLRLYQLPKL